VLANAARKHRAARPGGARRSRKSPRSRGSRPTASAHSFWRSGACRRAEPDRRNPDQARGYRRPFGAARAAEILAGLGFSHPISSAPPSNSRVDGAMRLALAATLFAEPDLLLLDEPTTISTSKAPCGYKSILRAIRAPSSSSAMTAISWTTRSTGSCTSMAASSRSSAVAIRRSRTPTSGSDRRSTASSPSSRGETSASGSPRLSSGFAPRPQGAPGAVAAQLLAKIEPTAAARRRGGIARSSFPRPAKPLSPPIIALDDVSVRI